MRVHRFRYVDLPLGKLKFFFCVQVIVGDMLFHMFLNYFQKQNSDRRYDYIEYENGMVFGQKNTCTKTVTKVDSWWRWLFWHCSYCFCYCDDNTLNSDRYFSLRKVESDIANNK